jgi:hypothetical protein
LATGLDVSKLLETKVNFDFVPRPLSPPFFHPRSFAACASVEEDRKSCGLDAARLGQIVQVQSEIDVALQIETATRYRPA